jgi:hypothetical protein
VTIALLALLLAHEEIVSASRFYAAGCEMRVTFTFSLEDLAVLAPLDEDRNGRVEPDEWARTLPSIFAYLGERFQIENGGERCLSEGDLSLLPPALALRDGRSPVQLDMRYRSSRPLDLVNVRCEIFREHGGNPRHVAELPGGRTIVFDRDRRETKSPIMRAGLQMPWTVAAAVAVVLLALYAHRKYPPICGDCVRGAPTTKCLP